MRGLFLLFIIMPITELLLLLEVGSRIGVLPTLAIVVSTAFIGINILRNQSFKTLNRARNRMQSGELPGQELVEGFMLAIGGALLLTPGFVTDFLGFYLLIPWTRQALARHLINSGRFSAWSTMNQGSGFTVFRSTAWSASNQNDDFIEGKLGENPDDNDKIPPL